MNFKMALQNMVWLSLPTVIYALVMRWRAQTGISERLGLKLGNSQSYLIALAVSVPVCIFSIWLSSQTSHFKGSMIEPFTGADPTLKSMIGVLAYGILATGFPEELLFRGLIAGICFRRISFWKANFLQAGIFTLPHLLILIVAPQLWPFVVLSPILLGLIMGWIRHSSGSIWPAVLIHASGNMAGAFAVMNWG